MKSSAPLARRAAAFGASAVVLAGMIGLVSSPAQAATSAKSAAKPKVSVTTPTPATRDYEGECPAKVNFSAKIKVKLKGKTTVAYRWLHGDGSKGKIKTIKLSGKGTKWVKVTQSNTFGEDVKGWEALQVLKPAKVTSKKGYFSVSCAKSEVIEIDEDQLSDARRKVSASVWASPDSYVGACTPGNKINFYGKIRVSKPSWVKYRWILNGEVVDYGRTKVWRSEKVGFGISPRDSQRGYAQLQVLTPSRVWSNKAFYKVWCKDEAPAARVSAFGLDTNTSADCKVSASAHISSTGRARVEYAWKVNGDTVSRGDVFFGDRGTRTVSLPAQALSGAATKGGKVTLTVFGPRNVDSVQTSYAACEAPKPTASVSSVGVAGQRNDMCDDGRGPGVDFAATLNSTGPTTVKYYWEINGKREQTLERQVNGSLNVTWGIAGTPGASVTSGTVKLVVISPNFDAGSAAFQVTCPPKAQEEKKDDKAGNAA